jgi:hypothetical protein
MNFVVLINMNNLSVGQVVHIVVSRKPDIVFINLPVHYELCCPDKYEQS